MHISYAQRYRLCKKYGLPEHCPFRLQAKQFYVIIYLLYPSLPAPKFLPYHLHISTDRHPVPDAQTTSICHASPPQPQSEYPKLYKISLYFLSFNDTPHIHLTIICSALSRTMQIFNLSYWHMACTFQFVFTFCRMFSSMYKIYFHALIFFQLDTSKQLKNISQIKVYNFDFKDSYAEYAGLEKDSKADTGVIAQEVGMLIPDAVREVGDVILPNGEIIESFLVVNKVSVVRHHIKQNYALHVYLKVIIIIKF